MATRTMSGGYGSLQKPAIKAKREGVVYSVKFVFPRPLKVYLATNESFLKRYKLLPNSLEDKILINYRNFPVIPELGIYEARYVLPATLIPAEAEAVVLGGLLYPEEGKPRYFCVSAGFYAPRVQIQTPPWRKRGGIIITGIQREPPQSSEVKTEDPLAD